MTEYFAGEKRGGLTLVGMGVVGVGAGGGLLASSSTTGDVGEGMAYPLLAMGGIHVAAGVFVYIASRGREAKLPRSPGWVEGERTRMKGVSKQFIALEVVEVVLIAGGLTMAGIGHSTERPRLEGIGYGLAIEAAATLAFDVGAARRAYGYREGLEPITPLFAHAIHF